MGGLAKRFVLHGPQIINQGTRKSGTSYGALKKKLIRGMQNEVENMQERVVAAEEKAVAAEERAEEKAVAAEERAVAAEERAVAAEERAVAAEKHEVEAQEALQRERGMQRQVVEEAVALALRLPR